MRRCRWHRTSARISYPEKVPPAGWNIWIISQACRRSCGRKNIQARSAGFRGKKLREKAAVLYINKRGGKGAADEISMDYGQYYIEFIKKQIRLLNPKTVVCCGEDLFRLIVMEVFQNKKQKKNREIYMKWKDLVRGDVFFADRDYRPVKETKKDEAEVRVVRMWNPSYRVNNGQYVSLEEYLKEFKRRLSGEEENKQGEQWNMDRTVENLQPETNNEEKADIEEADVKETDSEKME